MGAPAHVSSPAYPFFGKTTVRSARWPARPNASGSEIAMVDRAKPVESKIATTEVTIRKHPKRVSAGSIPTERAKLVPYSDDKEAKPVSHSENAVANSPAQCSSRQDFGASPSVILS